MTSLALADEAHAWLKRMGTAIKTLNYVGTFVFIHANHVESMRVIHAVHQNEERERLISLNGSPREIIRDSNQLICIIPETKSVMVEKSRPRKYIPEALLNLDQGLDKHYLFHIIGKDRIAGMSAIIIAIKPRDAFRYGYRLWIGTDTNLLLKSEVVNEHGAIVEQLVFTELKVHEKIDPQLLKPEISSEGFTWHREMNSPRPMPQEHLWKITQLPPGFKPQMHMEHNLPNRRMAVEHWVLSDGLATVSVYIEKPQAIVKDQLRGFSTMGAINAYGTALEGYQLIVVGEVPKVTVMMIGQSIRKTP